MKKYMFRRTRTGAFLFLLLAFVSAAPAALRDDTERVHVQYVFDGDSLKLSDGRQVRLIGINAPEFGKHGAPNQPLAVQARTRLVTLIEGKDVTLRHGVERSDRYGRSLAYLFLKDGRDPQEILLKEGLAWYIAISPNVARLSKYRSAEAYAHAKGLGIWATDAYKPIPAERLLSRGQTGFARITGIVSAVAHRGRKAVLFLPGHVRLDLATDVVFPWPLESLRGKHVLARGWLAPYRNGLRMRITHAAMLELFQ